MRTVVLGAIAFLTAIVIWLSPNPRPRPALASPPAVQIEPQGAGGAGSGWFAIVLPYLEDDLTAPLRRDDLSFVRSAPANFPSGRVVAADLMMLPEAAAFARNLPRKTHTIDALVEVPETGGAVSGRVVMVGIRFSDVPIARWIDAAFPKGTFTPPQFDFTTWLLTKLGYIAPLPPFKVKQTSEGELGCFAVDIAHVGYFDERLYRRLENSDTRRVYDQLFDTLRPGDKNRPVFARIRHSLGDGVAFNSGDSDGCFASYFGLDVAGRPAALVTDFTGQLALPGTASAPTP